MESLVSRIVPDASRGALVVYADDGSYYRVIQDFSKKAVNLSKYNPSTKEFALMHKDWDSAAQFMAGLLPGLSAEDHARLFVFRRDSGQGRPAANSGAAAGLSAPKPAAARSGRTSALETRLAELRETLQKAEEAADAEYKLEAAKLRLGEIAKKLESVEDAERRAADLDAQLAELKGCADLPEDLSELISVHEEQQGRKQAKADELQQDIEALKMQIGDIPQASLLTEKLFIAGVLLGVLAVAAGLFVLTADQAVFFPLGILGSLVLAVGGWYNSARRNAQRKVVQKDIEALEAELAELEKGFQEGGSTILQYMKATNSSTSTELKDKADNYRYFRSLRQDLEEQRMLLLGGTAPEEIQAEYARVQEEIAGRAQAAQALASYAVDTYSVRQEIERIESELGTSGAGGFLGVASEIEAAGQAAAPAAQPVNYLTEIALAGRISGVETDTLVTAVEAAGRRNLSAASGGKYTGIELGDDGRPAVQDKSGMKADFSDLSHGTRELVRFCLQAAIVEAISGKRRLPFLLDDPFTGFDLVRQQAACQILRALAAKTQVILFTSNPALKAPNDAAAELK
jgi:DNA repair exonuclease SbcCD ATPase subunit